MSAGNDYGYFEFTIKEYMAKHKISKYRLLKSANLQQKQMQTYYNGDIQRPDFAVLARICCALDCQLSDIVKYIPPKAY